MRTEAAIRQCLQWMERAIAIYRSDEPDYPYVVGAMRGQMDILKWTLGQPNNWDGVYETMTLRYAAEKN